MRYSIDEARYVTTRRYVTNCYKPFREWRRYVTIVTYRSRDAPFLHDNERKSSTGLQIPYILAYVCGYLA
jgi:hypothetical protein